MSRRFLLFGFVAVVGATFVVDADGRQAAPSRSATVADVATANLVQGRRPRKGRPRIVRHPDVRAEATGSRGAIVKYRKAVVRNATSIRYSKRSGTLFPLGTTIVTIVARNSVGVSRSTFKVIVLDTTPPVFAALADLTVTATGFSGATVTFPPITVTDRVDLGVTVTCAPTSGSLFPVGTTTVNCSARDASGNTATASFRVIVNLWPPRAVDGTYNGTTSQGKPISFSVVGGGYYVATPSIRFSITCASGAGYDVIITAGPSDRFGIGPDGRAQISGAGFPISGAATGTGTVTVSATFAVSGAVTGTAQLHEALTAPVADECDSGTVSWTATRTA
jgi:hypothetical protein